MIDENAQDNSTAKRCSHVTIRDVARLADTSVSTVSRYLNGSGHICKETSHRITNAMRALRYTPNIAARSLRGEGRKTVLLVVPDICNPFYAQIAKSAQWLLKDRGYAMVLFDSNDSLWEANAIKMAQEMFVSGILLASVNIQEDMVQKFSQTHIPVVLLCSIENSPFDMVHGDIANCMYIATHHLIALGHKRIAFAGGNSNLVHEHGRVDGYERAMREAGLPVDPKYRVEVGFSQTSGYECGRILASRRPLPTAVCCANDLIALGLMSAMNERGISIPNQISVIGMDNIPYDKVSWPTLTSVTNNGEQFAQESVRMLLERIEGIIDIEPRDVLVQRELIIRGSVTSYRETDQAGDTSSESNA